MRAARACRAIALESLIMMPRRRLLAAAAITALPLLPGPVRAALPVPKGRVVLTISGRIGLRNAGETARFDMDMLAAMPQHSFSTKTPWYPTACKFTGPLLRDVLAAAGAHGRTLRAIALNDYRVELPVEDASRYSVLLARLLDDKPMSVREKGPLFIIYPFDADETLRSERYYSRSAWQLKVIEVE
jgi:hypothetical protein